MKLAIGIFVVGQLLTVAALAEQPCGNGETWNGLRCATIGGGIVAGAALNEYVIHKYDEIDSIEKQYTEKFWNSETSPKATDNWIHVTNSVADGDKVTITYHLNENANRKLYIAQETEKMYENAEKVKGYTRNQPAFREPGREKIQRWIDKLTDENKVHQANIARAQSGGKIDFIPQVKVIDSVKNNRWNAQKELFNAEDLGSKVISVERLPAEKALAIVKANKLKGLANKGMYAAGIFAAEELWRGHAAKALTKEASSTYSPRKEDYGSTQAGQP